MEIIRLRQERREADGERSRDEKGRRLFGEESWFTFDNRRLYCLQRSALQLWPAAVAVVVKVLYDFPEVRCARHKFRTTSDGCTVKISLPDGQMGSLWNWQEASRSMKSTKMGTASVLEAVKRDTSKNSKEMLADVPPVALLSPGSREATVAERFNLGASRGTDKMDGKVAGQQLLSLLKGGGSSSNDGVPGPAPDLSALFAPQPQAAPPDGGWAAEPRRGGGKGRGRGRGRGGGFEGAGAEAAEKGGDSRGRRRPRGRGKGEAWA